MASSARSLRLRRAQAAAKTERVLEQNSELLERARTGLEQRLLTDSDARLAAGAQSSDALLAEAQLIEADKVAGARRFDEDFELHVPFDRFHQRYRHMLEHEASSDSPRIRHSHCCELWKFSLNAFSHWLQDSYQLRRSGELRRRAFGAPDYPTLVCQRCYRLQGWLASSGSGEGEIAERVGHRDWCDYCLWSERLRDLGRTAMGLGPWPGRGRYYAVAGRYDAAAAAEYEHVRRGPGRLLRFFRLLRPHRYESERRRAWGAVVHDLLGDSGPEAPEPGFALWIPERFELESVDGQELLVHFWAGGYRWGGARWRRLGQKADQSLFAGPTVFSAALAPAQLASAWHDFRFAVATVNRRAFDERLAEQELAAAQALERAERRALLDSRRGAAQLLER